jgi:hypothetical protein
VGHELRNSGIHRRHDESSKEESEGLLPFLCTQRQFGPIIDYSSRAFFFLNTRHFASFVDLWPAAQQLPKQVLNPWGLCWAQNQDSPLFGPTDSPHSLFVR